MGKRLLSFIRSIFGRDRLVIPQEVERAPEPDAETERVEAQRRMRLAA